VVDNTFASGYDLTNAWYLSGDGGCIGAIFLKAGADYTNLWTIISDEEDCFYRFNLLITNGWPVYPGPSPFDCIVSANCSNGFSTDILASAG